MEKLFIILIDMAVFAKIVLIGFVAFMAIQLISYRVFNFNIYKTALRAIKEYMRG